MRLGFVYYEPTNNIFRKNLVRYNTLLKKYFESNDSSISKKLHETLNNILSQCMNYEILTSEESEVYNIIIEFLANNLDDKDLSEIKNQNSSESINSKITQKISTIMPDVDIEIVKAIIDKSQNVLKFSNSKNIEVVFIPSVINL